MNSICCMYLLLCYEMENLSNNICFHLVENKLARFSMADIDHHLRNHIYPTHKVPFSVGTDMNSTDMNLTDMNLTDMNLRDMNLREMNLTDMNLITSIENHYFLFSDLNRLAFVLMNN